MVLVDEVWSQEDVEGMIALEAETTVDVTPDPSAFLDALRNVRTAPEGGGMRGYRADRAILDEAAFFDPKAAGAVGDGIHDDTAAVRVTARRAGKAALAKAYAELVRRHMETPLEVGERVRQHYLETGHLLSQKAEEPPW